MSTSEPVGTTVRFKVADGAGNLLSDIVLPGNSTGFTSDVDLTGISKAAYPSLSLVGYLDTNSVEASPTLLDWSIEYLRGPVPLELFGFGAASTLARLGGEVELRDVEHYLGGR